VALKKIRIIKEIPVEVIEVERYYSVGKIPKLPKLSAVGLL